MKRELSKQEYKEILNLIKNVGEDIDRARKSKINVTEKIKIFIKNDIELTEKQAVQLDLLVDECNYKIKLLQRGE